MMGNTMGWFCPACPILVVNMSELESDLQHSLPHWNVGEEVAVLGLVDLDAIPEEKQHVELGSDENPIPLVRFRYGPDSAASPSPALLAKRNARRQARLSRRANRPKKRGR
jgi:hypothetical protein